MRALRCLIALALAIAGPLLTGGPATAVGSTYCTGSGVNVAIDFGALGGGVQKGCGRGSVAADAIQSAGFTLGYIQTGGMSGFVCTVNGKPGPSQGGCTGANGNGYWALFVAGPGGQWSYASQGANSQPVNNGQTVAFAWQAPGSGQRDPGTAPAGRVAPRPTGTPTRRPTVPKASVGALAGITPGSTPTARATASRAASAQAKRSIPPTPSMSPSASPSTWSSAAPAPTTTATVDRSSSGGGLAWWIPVGIVLLLVGGAGLTWWRRRAGG